MSRTRARIGEARDTWVGGIVSHAKAQARRRGLAPGDALRIRWLRLVGAKKV